MSVEAVKDRFRCMPEGMTMDLAVVEAERCLLCHDAPCSKACPADTKPGEFIRKFQFRNYTGAMRTIKTNNILGGACGVLCPTERLCEKECSAVMKSEGRPGGTDRPVRIGDLQRFIVEYGRSVGFQPLEVKGDAAGKIAVVGSGPSGLSCAGELAKMGYEVTIFEALPEPGGVLRYGVVPFRCDSDFVAKEIEDVKSLGVTIRCNSPIEGPAAAEKLLSGGFDAVFLGPGLWDAFSVVDNAGDIEGRWSSVDFLAAIRDGRLDDLIKTFKGKKVAVVGGGSVAMDSVEGAIRLDPESVNLVYRRSYTQMPAEEEERIAALRCGVNFHILNQPVEYVTDASGKLTGLKLVRTVLGAPDASGRRRPVEVEGSEWIMSADIVIEAVGNKAPSGLASAYPSVKTDDKGLVGADEETGATSVPGIFAGGDIVRGPALVVEAVADGKKAAKAIDAYICSGK